MRISHLEAKYGFEEIEDVLEPSEFETGLIQEPTPDSSHIDDAIVLRDNLGAIAEQAEEHPEVALEHYHWSVKQILGTKSVPMPRKLGLENFGDTARDRRSFIREIRSLESHLDSNIQISLEAYSEAIEKQFKAAIAENAKISKNLDQQIKRHSDRPVIISNKTALGIFIRGNEFVNGIKEVSETANGSVDSICDLVRQLREDLEGSKLNLKAHLRKYFESEVKLLMNYSVIVNGDDVRLAPAAWDAEDVVEKALKGRAIKGMIEGGIWYVGGVAMQSFIPVMTSVFGIVGLFGTVTASMYTAWSGIFKGVGSLIDFFKREGNAEKINKESYKDFHNCALVILKQSKGIDKFVRLNDSLKSDDLENSVKLQRILLEGVKYINELQYNVTQVYEKSAELR